ncbi:MAG TPA: alpha-N-arabinofuranosidase [Actinophytocola sp.]|uniref:arabinosylfuranosidase ArfA n=1 Tax=Actinophytocola sp. TaxID=1872138 RepID=UPI002DBFDF8E|nr:alpha-N-arabinofuranosidase [Actinophytocola sp.]HEU5475514.1 alpha-N-arabinofuranosidase [Actinophytocola sp.]
MITAALTLDPAVRIAPVGRRLFGSFVEHMGRCVYSGIYEPGHPAADDRGFRGDVLELVRELGVGVVRYPGGNFVSGYRWEDGVGPPAERPTRLDLAWRQIEPNAFGLGEFMAWTRAARVEPMLAVNLGTRGIQEACDLIEYANHPGGTYLADLRARHGDPDPYGIRLWCLGNEVDGHWQIGHKTAVEYGRLANETAKAMRAVDPGVELVLCGSSGATMPTFGAWEATVLELAYDAVDHISLHSYYEENADLASFLATPVAMDRFIADVVATADHVRAKLRRQKRITLSFDEWNVWNMSRFPGRAEADWEHAPVLIEDTYTAADAVAVGGYLITLLRNADRVAVACQAQLVNVIAPIRTDRGGAAWRQTIFHPFALTARHARGEVLRVEPAGPTVDTVAHGEVPVLDAVATHDPESGAVALFAMNRHTTEPVTLTADLRALGPVTVTGAHILADPDPHAVNDRAHPDRVRPRALDLPAPDGGRLTAVLPPVSWSVITLHAGEPA